MKVMLDDGAYMPERAYPDDAGLDLRTPYQVRVPANGSATIDTGVHIEIPTGCYGKLESKSGLMCNRDIICLGGVIDSSYRGSIAVKMYNLSDKDFWFEAGDKIAQLVISFCKLSPLILADSLSDTDRADNGFGSTGR